MPRGQCRLCNAEADLQLSHILPAFGIRWLRESSGSGHIRLGASPNQRVQDGLKRHWLCTSCEGLLGRSETDFAEKLFYPYIRRESSRFVYGEWLLRFCVSVSWRVLVVHKEETALKNYTPEDIARIAKAEEAWKAFLLGRRPHPSTFQQHIIPLDAISTISSGSRDISSNINRYLMRAIDMDLCRGKKINFVYSKIGRFIILGFIREDRPGRWNGAKVHVKTGRIEPRTYVMPREFFEYLNSRARHLAELFANISPRQRKKIDKTFRANIDKFIGSDEFVAIQNDVRMFGDAAFTQDCLSEEGKSNGDIQD